jgi:hypothetical protein
MLNTCFVSICISRMLRIWCVISIYQSSLERGEMKKGHFFATHSMHSRSLPKNWNIVHYIHYKKTWSIWWKNLIKKTKSWHFPTWLSDHNGQVNFDMAKLTTCFFSTNFSFNVFFWGGGHLDWSTCLIILTINKNGSHYE